MLRFIPIRLLARHITLFLTLLLCSACSGVTTNGEQRGKTLAQGIVAYEKQDYSEALRLLKPLADRSDRHAAALVSRMYFLGEGGAKNVALATHYFKIAVKEEDKEAHYKHALNYLQRREFQEAQLHLEVSAQQGHVLATYELAQLLIKGPPHLKDVCRGLHLYKSIAKDYIPAWNAVKAWSEERACPPSAD